MTRILDSGQASSGYKPYEASSSSFILLIYGCPRLSCFYVKTFKEKREWMCRECKIVLGSPLLVRQHVLSHHLKGPWPDVSTVECIQKLNPP